MKFTHAYQLDRQAMVLPVRDYVQRIGGPSAAIAFLGHTTKTALQLWSTRKQLPLTAWKLLEAHFGPQGFHPVMIDIKPPKRPFRVPLTWVQRLEQTGKPAVSTPPESKRKTTIEDALLDLATALDQELRKVNDQTLGEFRTAFEARGKVLEGMQQGITDLQERLRALESLLHPDLMGKLVASEPTPAPPHHEAPSLKQLLDALKPAHPWEVTHRAEREYAKLTPQQRTLYDNLIRDIAQADDPRWWSRFGSVKMHDNVAKQLHEEEVWALKADRRLRMFVARQDGVRRIAGFTERSNHRFYGRET